MPPGVSNFGEIGGALAGILLSADLFQELAVSNDGIEGSAQFMAHAGQKPALRLVGGFGGIFEGLKLLLTTFELDASGLKALSHLVERAGQISELVLLRF